jgi:hypothetical protein
MRDFFSPLIGHVVTLGTRVFTGPEQPAPTFVPFGALTGKAEAAQQASNNAMAGSSARMFKLTVRRPQDTGT